MLYKPDLTAQIIQVEIPRPYDHLAQNIWPILPTEIKSEVKGLRGEVSRLPNLDISPLGPP